MKNDHEIKHLGVLLLENIPPELHHAVLSLINFLYRRNSVLHSFFMDLNMVKSALRNERDKHVRHLLPITST